MREEILAFGPDLLVFIERLGRAEDGLYYNMRAEDVSATTAPLDGAALSGNVKVLAVGDGGAGSRHGYFPRKAGGTPSAMPHASPVVGAEAALPVDVSDWGGYALASPDVPGVREWIGPGPGNGHHAGRPDFSRCGGRGDPAP